MGILVWIILGGIAGWIASIIMGTNAEQGIVGNVIIGVIGAFIGGLIANLIGGDGVNGFNIYSILVAVFGASLTLFVLKRVS